MARQGFFGAAVEGKGDLLIRGFNPAHLPLKQFLRPDLRLHNAAVGIRHYAIDSYKSVVEGFFGIGDGLIAPP